MPTYETQKYTCQNWFYCLLAPNSSSSACFVEGIKPSSLITSIIWSFVRSIKGHGMKGDFSSCSSWFWLLCWLLCAPVAWWCVVWLCWNIHRCSAPATHPWCRHSQTSQSTPGLVTIFLEFCPALCLQYCPNSPGLPAYQCWLICDLEDCCYLLSNCGQALAQGHQSTSPTPDRL